MKVQCAKPKVEIIPVGRMNSWLTKEGTLSHVQPIRMNTKYAKQMKFQNQIALPLF